MSIKAIFLDVVGVLDLSGSRNAALIDNLEKIKQDHHLKIIITTNSTINQNNDPYGVTALADLIVNSTPTTPKPSPEFWQSAYSQAIQLLPSLQINEVLVIDDRSDINSSAREFGFQTLHYTRGVSEGELNEIFSSDTEEANTVLSSPEAVDKYFHNF